MLRGGGSKPALSAPRQGVELLELGGLRGLLEYQPAEYTFTALAGTPLAEVEAELRANGQFLPFDPPLAESGATLGGTVAAGMSGPGRYRFGGVRDFLMGITFIDGGGRLVRSGGRVVKNAAGFDLSKLMVGSLGRYGVLVELSFKVFPRPAATLTWQADFDDLSRALEVLIRLSGVALDLAALDLDVRQQGVRLLARLAGPPESFPPRLERYRKLIGTGEPLEGEADQELWRGINHFRGLRPSEDGAGSFLVKIPLTPRHVLRLDEILAAVGAPRRYSAAANLAWVSWPDSIETLEKALVEMDLSGLVVMGDVERVRLGVRRDEAFAGRVKQALDPQARWVEV
jgi:glycolate oxidase FAD binding subunit